jgi:hypothetical protein
LSKDFLCTHNHKSIWNSFSNFLDERFAEEDLSEILDEDEVTRAKTAPTIPPMLQFEPQIPGEVESKSQSGRGPEGNHSQASLMQGERHSILMILRSYQKNSIQQLC